MRACSVDEGDLLVDKENPIQRVFVSRAVQEIHILTGTGQLFAYSLQKWTLLVPDLL